MATISTAQLGRLRDDHVDIEDLRELMEIVNETTQALQSTHVALTQEVHRLKGELADANRQLAKQQELAALGEMAAGIAHEIRNPLGSIQLYVQLLRDDVAGRQDESKLCRKIDVAVRTMDAIVTDVLTFARDLRIRPVRTTAHELFTRAIAHVDAIIARHDITVNWSNDAGCELDADLMFLTQALGNVMRNAIEAMVEADVEDRGITIGAEERPVRCPDGTRAPRCVLTVRDNGPGLPEDVAARMFNPFYTTRATGTGLGLAIVHRIVVAHGGHVLAENAPAGGAMLSLCLPPDNVGSSADHSNVPATIDAARAHAAALRDQLVEGETT